MAKFASGRNALAICDRSGLQYRYRVMKREWNGLLVGPDQYEPKHPQLGPFRTVSDPEALQDARPAQAEALQVYVGIPTVEGPNLRPVQAVGFVGQVSLTGVADSVSVTITGVSATGNVGSVTVTTTTNSAPSFDSTSVTLDTTTDTFDEE
jgi:hypothetical protein